MKRQPPSQGYFQFGMQFDEVAVHHVQGNGIFEAPNLNNPRPLGLHIARIGIMEGHAGPASVY
ncbi:MAG: hypothetical protein FJX63_00040 [Alphaproteobacteria bacterium]|nr:hypothetical protein [Alphaproteobacteria bacterium]